MLIVFEPNRVPYYKTGVSWAGDDRRLGHARPFKLNGVWDFTDNKPRNACRLHKELLEAQEQNRIAQEQQLARDIAAKEAAHARRKQAIEQPVEQDVS